MTNRAVIRLNDLTDHGGKVITAIDDWIYQGVPIAAKGDLVNCPKCKGVFPIVEGSDNLKHQGKPVALEGMHTACGAKLVASQKDFLAQLDEKSLGLFRATLMRCTCLFRLPS